MSNPSVTSISEVRKGDLRLVAVVIEVDVVDAPEFLTGFDTTTLDPAQLGRVAAAAELVSIARQAELDAQAAAAKAKIIQDEALEQAKAADEARAAADRAKAEADAQPADATGTQPTQRM